MDILHNFFFMYKLTRKYLAWGVNLQR